MAKAKKKVAKKKTVKKAVKKAGKKKLAKRGKFLPAYFLSLSVENVRCFGPKQTIDLSDGKGRPAQWTVVLGDNNTGKTTLLQCLAALEPTPITSRLDYNNLFPAMLGFQHPWSSILPWEYGQRLNLRKFASKEQVCLAYEAFYGVKLNELVTCANTLSFSMTINFVEDGGYRSASFHSSRKLKEICRLICYGYGASRIMGETSLAEKTPDHPSASLFKDDVELINAEEWLLQADYAVFASKSLKLKKRAEKKRDQIREVLINLLPEVDDIRVVGPTKNRPKPRVEFETPYGWIALNGLSLGYRAMITWMVDLANRMFERYPKSSNPLEEPAVVLVDEIDLHLHPKWQRILMDYLSERFVNTQFIVTAHSPLVVQAAKNANVVLLKREDDHVIIDNNPQSVQGWRADQILTSLFALPSGYSVEIEELQKQRREILSKARLTAADKKKLKDIESKMGDLPTAETPEDIEAMNIIRRAAKALKK